MSSSPALEQHLGQPLPAITLPAHDGTPFALRGRVGLGPLALFLFIRNGTPG